MISRIGNVLATIFGSAPVMSPEEIQDRVEMLESKVESNKLALERHEVDTRAHQGDGTSDQ